MAEDSDTPSIADVRTAVRDLCKRFPLEYWREHDRDAAYPGDFIDAFAEAGWLGATIPTEYGGLGLGVTQASVMLQEVAASGAGMSGASAIHGCVFPPGPLIHHGSDELKAEYLPKLASGEITMAFGVTEPDAGLDTSRITTRATRSGDRWTIHGKKVWISNAQHASKILLLTRTEPRDDAHPLRGLTLFFTDLDRSKCTIREIDKLGRAAIDSNELFIDGIEATDGEIVGELGGGFRCLLDGINPERIVVGMEAVGIGRRALEMASQYAKDRVVFGRAIGVNQAVAHPLAASWMHLEAAEMMGLKAAAAYDRGDECGPEANAAKYLGAEAGFDACDRAMQTHGGYAYAKEYHIERLWREARLLRLVPISQEMVLNFVSTKVLGLPRSY